MRAELPPTPATQSIGDNLSSQKRTDEALKETADCVADTCHYNDHSLDGDNLQTPENFISSY